MRSLLGGLLLATLTCPVLATPGGKDILTEETMFRTIYLFCPVNNKGVYYNVTKSKQGEVVALKLFYREGKLMKGVAFLGKGVAPLRKVTAINEATADNEDKGVLREWDAIAQARCKPRQEEQRLINEKVLDNRRRLDSIPHNIPDISRFK